MIAVIFPISSFFFLWYNLFLHEVHHSSESDWRKSFLLASLTWGFFLVVSTELLSSVFLLEFRWLTLTWVFFTLFLASWTLRNIHLRKKIVISAPNFDRFSFVLIIAITLIIIILGVIAWIAPPNNYDSMTYHMSRVVHWIQNKSVAPYPTVITRQNWQNPYAEFTIMQLQIFWSGDRLANFVQWFSMVAACLGSSLIAKQLGANIKGQIIASVLTITLPMGILQATSTQNDYVFTWWMLCFIYVTINFIQRPNMMNSVWLGLSLGLAILTKAIAYPVAGSYVIFLALFLLIRYRHQAVKLISIIIAMVFLINGGFVSRNYLMFGSLIGTGDFSKYANEVLSVPALSSNIIRNLGLHTWTPFYAVNSTVDQIVDFIHQKILHIAVDDPRTTGYRFQYPLARNPLNEDYAGNPFHLLLIIGAILALLFNKGLRSSRILLWYSGMLIISFVFLCAYLKWQPWASRLHLVLFVLWSPFVAVILTQFRSSFLANLTPTIAILLAIPWILMNSAKPLLPRPQSILTMERSSIIFFDRPQLYKPYRDAIAYIKNDNSFEVGLLLDGDDWEYPLWALANEGIPANTYRFNHLPGVNSNSGLLTNLQPPKYIITTDAKRYSEINYGGKYYSIVWSEAPLAILTRK